MEPQEPHETKASVGTTRPRRYLSGQRRREEILDAAGELFVESGFQPVSLRDIAARAGLSHPGLLRHFSSKDEILDTLVDRFERANHEWLVGSGLQERPGIVPVGVLARHNAGVPGYTELFATLAGEATTESHPAHSRMRDRYRRLRDATTVQFASITVSPAQARAEGTRLLAAWDGLQLLSIYEPHSIDVATRLEQHLAELGGEAIPRTPYASFRSLAALEASLAAATIAHKGGGYAPGRARRERILHDAADLFAERGFTGTSLSEIADRVGITKSTLLHHVSSKDELLAAVLAIRDGAVIDSAGDESATARQRLLDIPAKARENAGEAPGLIELHAVLSCEGAASSHPAHEYFTRRFAWGRAFFINLFEQLAADGDLLPGLDPEREGTWLVALWEGLQYQFLYEPEAVDVADLLEGHILRVLGASGTSS